MIGYICEFQHVSRVLHVFGVFVPLVLRSSDIEPEAWLSFQIALLCRLFYRTSSYQYIPVEMVPMCNEASAYQTVGFAYKLSSDAHTHLKRVAK